MIAPTPYAKMVNRMERLRKFLALEPPAPRSVVEKELLLIEQAREEWRAEEGLEAWMDWNERQDVENGVSGTVYPSRERALRNSPEGGGPVCRVMILPLEVQR